MWRGHNTATENEVSNKQRKATRKCWKCMTNKTAAAKIGRTPIFKLCSIEIAQFRFNVLFALNCIQKSIIKHIYYVCQIVNLCIRSCANQRWVRLFFAICWLLFICWLVEFRSAIHNGQWASRLVISDTYRKNAKRCISNTSDWREKRRFGWPYILALVCLINDGDTTSIAS